MKKLLPLFLLFFISVQGQVKDLAELSSGKYLDSRIVYNDDGDDVYGYLLLYENDRKSKAVYELEYVLLDKNLNKLTSGTFVQNRFSFIVKLNIGFSFVRKIGNKLVIGIQDSSNNSMMGPISAFNHRFRELDLETFKLSNQFTMKDNRKTVESETADSKVTYDDVQKNNALQPVGRSNFLLFDLSTVSGAYAGESFAQKVARDTKSFKVFDKEFNEIWNYKFNDDGTKAFDMFEYYSSNGNDMIMVRYNFEKIGKYLETYYDVFDLTSGLKKFSIKQSDGSTLNQVQTIKYEKDKLIIYSLMNYMTKKQVYDNSKVLGVVQITYDRSTGAKLSEEKFFWRYLDEHLKISEEGEIKSYGYLQFLNFRLLNNGHTTAIAEGYNPSNNSRILDMFVMEFDQNMKLVYYKKVDKTKNMSNIAAWGPILQNSGAFDYLYSQKLEGDNYAYFYTDNEKNSTRNPKWILGVITQVDGKYSYEKIPMTTEKGQIYPVKAKNGYILLREVSDKKSTIRLEKINY